MIESSFTFIAVDNSEIFVRKWSPETTPPRAVLQLVHGAAEHSGRYRSLAKTLTARGFVVYADDHRGHGQTAGELTRLGIAKSGSWSAMLEDLRQLHGLIGETHPQTPLFLFGHSLGSLMCQQSIQNWGTELAGVILCGTFGDSPGLDELLPILEQAAATAPDEPSEIFTAMFAQFNAPFSPAVTGFEWLSRDAKEVQKYVADPRCGFPFSNQLALDCLKGTVETWDPAKESRIPKNLPVFFIAGSCDPAGRNGESVRGLIARYQQLGLTDVSEIIYEGARHEILNETNADEVRGDILHWLTEHLSG